LSFFSGAEDWLVEEDELAEEEVDVGAEKGERFELGIEVDAESAFALAVVVVDTEDDVAEDDPDVVV
jgi:hypothetical protein